MTRIRIIVRHNAKFDFKSKFIIYKQVLNNVILIFECEAQI